MKKYNDKKKNLVRRISIIFLLLSMVIGPLSAIKSNVYAEGLNNINLLDNSMYSKLRELYDYFSSLEDEIIYLRQENNRLEKNVAQPAAEKVPVLMYHHIYDGDLSKSKFNGNGAVISLDTFKEHMKYLKDNDFYTATLEELENFMNGDIVLPEKTVVLTFDDGYYSNIEYAYPILKNYNFRAAIFSIATNISSDPDKYSAETGKLKGLSFNNLRETRDVFTFESHTYDLHVMMGDKSALEVLSKKEILNDISLVAERLDTKYVAYPYGNYNETSTEAFKEAGYKLGFTTKNGYCDLSTKPFEVPRFGIFPWNNMDYFVKIVNRQL
ncbi:MAG: polysaccharide deacetylase family protein [Tissierellaceae bacterium]|nr:polysaccharide deacetylase family protein [Tissierellaceae bacterium]